MRKAVFVGSLVLLWGVGSAMAQEPGEDMGIPSSGEGTQETGPSGSSQGRPQKSEPVHSQDKSSKSLVPHGMAYSLGFGVAPGGNLFTSPQINPEPMVAVRINLSRTLVIEPVLAMTLGKVKDQDTTFGLAIQGLVKYAFLIRSRGRLYGLAGLGFGYSHTETDQLGISLPVGFGGEYFFSRHWSISLDVISQLLSVGYQSADGGESVWSIDMTIQSVIVRPSIHLYL